MWFVDKNTPVFMIISTIALIIVYFFNHALYHITVEIFCIFLGIMIFIMAINSKEYSSKNILLSMGILYLYVGVLDFLHMNSLEEINVLNVAKEVNLTYWGSARFLESAGILYLFWKFRKPSETNYRNEHIILFLYTFLAVVFIFVFLHDLDEGNKDVLLFRNVLETIVIVFLICSLFISKYLELPKEKRLWIHIAIGLKLVSEVLVFSYSESHEVAIVVSHITRYLSYLCFYLIFVIMTLKEPYKNVFSVYKKEHDKLLFLSEIDQLTGVYNHSTTVKKLNELIEKYKDSDEILFVTMVDLDDFKNVNDTFGHQIGDQVLQGFAETLTKSNYKDKVVGRYGGDEFIIAGVFVDEMEMQDRYDGFAERIRNKFKKIGVEVEFSSGVAIYEDGDSVNDLIYKADIAMYESKRLGKSRVSVWKGE